jgi:hypothetical protein
MPKSVHTTAAHLRLLNAMMGEVLQQFCKVQAAQDQPEADTELAALSPMVNLFDDTVGLVWSEAFVTSVPVFDYCPKVEHPNFAEVAKQMNDLIWYLENIGKSEAHFTRSWLSGLSRKSANLVGAVDWLLGELDPPPAVWPKPPAGAEVSAVSEHRLSPLGGAGNTLAMADTVTMMANKAISVVSMLSNAFAEEGETARPSDDALYYALQSVSDELADIKAVISNFHQAAKNQHA